MSICVTLSSIRFPTLTAHASSPFKILRIYAKNSAFRMNWYITVIPRESEIAVGPQLTPLGGLGHNGLISLCPFWDTKRKPVEFPPPKARCFGFFSFEYAAWMFILKTFSS